MPIPPHDITVRVYFQDGTCEERPENTGCVFGLDAPPKCPSDTGPSVYVVLSEEWYFCGRYIHTLESARGHHVWVWQLTGADPESGLLTGQWREVRVETWEEQGRRLLRERDAARRLCLSYCSSGAVSIDEWKVLRAQARTEGWLP